MQIQHSSQFIIARQLRQVRLVVYLMQNLRLRGRPPPIIFARRVRPMNTLQLCPDSFHTSVTAEALRAKIEQKLRFRTNAVTLIQNLWYKGSPLTNHFYTVS